MFRVPFECTWLAIITGGVYVYLKRKSPQSEELSQTFVLSLIWSAWTLVIIVSVGPLLTGPFPPDPPGLSPSPSIIRAVLFT
jgi:hypothetical protein